MIKRVRYIAICLVILPWSWSCQHTGAPPEASPAQDSAPATHLVEIRTGNQVRDFWVHDPFRDGTRRSLLIALHGLGSTGLDMMQTADMLDHARQSGYVVIAPNAAGDAFNDGSPLRNRTVDDVAFIESAVDWFRAARPIDPDRIFVTGFSTGASMAFRLAAESGIPLAGLAAVSGHAWVDPALPVDPIPSLIIFGDNDPWYPLEGGSLIINRRYIRPPTVDYTTRNWARRFNCTTTVSNRMNYGRQTGRFGCDGDVRVVMTIIDNHGHYWPRVPRPDEFQLQTRGPIQTEVHATHLIWDFFSSL